MPLPIQTVLVATDLTEASDEVVRTGAQIASLAGATLHVVHAQAPDGSIPGVRETVLEMQDRLHRARSEMAEQLQRTDTEASVESARLVYDAPHRAIRERAREVSADLIILGPHRGRAFPERLLGTTADRLIRTSDVPCLIVRGPISLPLHHVVVATDLSNPAQLAVSEAFRWAAALGLPPTSEEREPTEVRAIFVVPLATEVSRSFTNWDWYETELHEQVENGRREVPETVPLRVREEILQHASPAEEILRVAGSGADLLVLGTHGRGALGRALIGSISSTVARKAEAPVLLVPPVMEVSKRSGEAEGEARKEGRSEDLLEVSAAAR